MSDLDCQTNSCAPNCPLSREKVPFFRLTEGQIRLLNLSFWPRAPPKPPIFRTNSRPCCRTTCPFSGADISTAFRSPPCLIITLNCEDGATHAWSGVKRSWKSDRPLHSDAVRVYCPSIAESKWKFAFPGCTLSAAGNPNGKPDAFHSGDRSCDVARQWRSRWRWASESRLQTQAIVSGLAETVISLALIIHRYLEFFPGAWEPSPDAALKRVRRRGAGRSGRTVRGGIRRPGGICAQPAHAAARLFLDRRRAATAGGGDRRRMRRDDALYLLA